MRMPQAQRACLSTARLPLARAFTAFRDEGRMRDKYGAQWDKYCKLVPYKIVPGLL